MKVNPFFYSDRHCSLTFRWNFSLAVLVVLTTVVNNVFSLPTIVGHSQWSKLLLIGNKGHWNFLNESTNVYENGAIYNCSDALTDAEKCPTELTIIEEELQAIPINLFAGCFARLNYLNMSKCGITEISWNRFQYAEHLIILDLSRNKITKLPSNIFDLAPNVEKIDLSHNEIVAKNVDDYAFEKCSSLKELDLSYNKLQHIHIYNRNWLAPLTNLEVLNLNYNYLNYQGSLVFDIEDYYNNVNLVSILAKNSQSSDSAGFSKISVHLPKLKHLIIPKSVGGEQTSIEKYNQKALDINLAILDVSGRGKEDLSISSNFKVVIANYNEIRNVWCAENECMVTELYVSHNQLTDIDFVEKLPNLEIADFSSNKLKVINENRLISLRNLRELNLANNQLRKLNLGIMDQIPSLNILDISHNGLVGEFEFNTNTKIEIFDIAGNQFTTISVGPRIITIRD